MHKTRLTTILTIALLLFTSTGIATTPKKPLTALEAWELGYFNGAKLGTNTLTQPPKWVTGANAHGE